MYPESHSWHKEQRMRLRVWLMLSLSIKVFINGDDILLQFTNEEIYLIRKHAQHAWSHSSFK